MEGVTSGRHLPGRMVEELRNLAQDGLIGQRCRRAPLGQAGDPTQLLQRVTHGLREASDDLVHADAGVHVRDAEALGRDQRGELGGLADHHVRAPALNRLEEGRQRGLRVDPPEHVPDHHGVRLLQRHAGQARHHRADQLGRRVGERLVRESDPVQRDAVRRGRGDHNLVTRLRTGPRERHQRPEVAVVGRRREEHPHVARLPRNSSLGNGMAERDARAACPPLTAGVRRPARRSRSRAPAGPAAAGSRTGPRAACWRSRRRRSPGCGGPRR